MHPDTPVDLRVPAPPIVSFSARPVASWWETVGSMLQTRGWAANGVSVASSVLRMSSLTAPANVLGARISYLKNQRNPALGFISAVELLWDGGHLV